MANASSPFQVVTSPARRLGASGGAAVPDARRRALLLGVPGVVALASPLALLGCGGGGGGDAGADGAEAADEAALQARVQSLNASLAGAQHTLLPLRAELPAGAKPTLTGALLITAFGQSEVRVPDGACGAVLLENGAQLATLVDADGSPLLIGFVEPGGAEKLDARTTAEALILLASDVSQHHPALGLALRKTLATHPIVGPVAAAVQAALARGPLLDTDTALIGAVNQAVNQLRPSRAGAAGGRAAHAQSIRVRATDGGDSEATARSGVWLRGTADYNALQVVNRFRRRLHVWLERRAYRSADGTEVESAAPLVDFALEPTTALSFNNLVIRVADYYAKLAQDIGFIEFYENDPTIWTAVASDAVQLPVAPVDKDPSSTVYSVRIVGPGTRPGDAMLTAAEQAKLDELLHATFKDDILIPFYQNIVAPWLTDALVTLAGPKFQSASAEVVAWMISDISSSVVGGQFFPNTWAALRNGDLLGAATNLGAEFLSSSTFQELLHRSLSALVLAVPEALPPAVPHAVGRPTVDGLVWRRGPGRKPLDVARAFSKAMQKFARIVNAIKTAATIGDYGAMVKDWRSSSRLEVMLAEATRARLTLSPNPVEVALNDSNPAPVTAKVEGLDPGMNAQDVFVEWSCTGRWGYLIRVGGSNEVNAFTAPLSAPSHNYFRSGGGQTDPDTPDVVTAVAYYRNPTTAQKEEIGRASVHVQFKKEFNLAFNLASGMEVPTGVPLPVSCFVKEKLPAGATVAWSWSHAGPGALTPLPPDDVPSDTAARLDTGETEGTATLTVTAEITVPATLTLPARVVPTDPVALPLKVKKGLRTITFEAQGGAFACTDPRACGVSHYGAYLVPVMPKATNYTAVFSGFGYAGCNRSVSWTGPVGDGGDCRFPITYHPHNSQGPTNTWAVWLGFSDSWNPAGGKCTVTITLAP